MIQVNVGDQAYPKLIYISKSLSPTEKQDLISFLWEYIYVFTWSNEDMLGLDPLVAMHHHYIKSDAKVVKQQQQWFWSDIMEAIEIEVHKLIEYDFI